MKPIAWYDPTNGAVSTDKDSPLFTPLGQVLPLFLEEQQITADCPNCEYHRKQAQLWRDEAYKQAGHPLPEQDGKCKNCTDGCPACDARKLPEQDWIERERAVGYREGHRAALAQRTWVGLTLEEILETYRGPDGSDYVNYARAIEAKLKEKNT